MSRKSASSYATLGGEDDAAGKKSSEGKSKGKLRLSTAKPLVTVRTAASTDDEASQTNDGGSNSKIAYKDKVIVCCKEEREEEKVSEEGSFPENFFETTRLMAVELVQRSSTMTSMVAKTLASNSIVNDMSNSKETKEANSTTNGENTEEKTGDEEQQGEDSNGIAIEREVGKRLNAAFSCGNDLIENSKDSFDSAFEKTHKAANDLIESSTCLGKEVMASTEQCTQAAIIDKLPLTPMLEQTSERLEQAYESVVSEIQEFLTDHWDLLQKNLFSKKGRGKIGNVRAADDTVLNVSIEVQMKPSQ